MEKKLLFMLLIGCFCVVSYAQDYPSDSSPYLNFSVSQQDLGFVSDTRVLFDATGGTDSHIQVTCRDGWFSVNSNDWLDVSENGNYLVVRCRPNPYPRVRTGQVSIVGGQGTRTCNITVQQEAAGNTPSRSSVQTNIVVPASESQSIPVKVSFGAEKTTPTFENVWSIIKLLENNDNLGLKIEIPWCRNEYSVKLIEERCQNITDYFIASGIDKNRISEHIIIDVNEGETACDRAYLKIVEQ